MPRHRTGRGGRGIAPGVTALALALALAAAVPCVTTAAPLASAVPARIAGASAAIA